MMKKTKKKEKMKKKNKKYTMCPKRSLKKLRFRPFHFVNQCKGSKIRVYLGSAKPYMYKLDIEGQQVEFEIDTGASFSILNEHEYKKMSDKTQKLKEKLTQDELKPRSYTGERLRVKGVLNVNVTRRDQVFELALVLVNGKGQNMLGRNWRERMKVDWKSVFTVREEMVNYETFFKRVTGKVQ